MRKSLLVFIAATATIIGLIGIAKAENDTLEKIKKRGKLL